MGKKRPKIHRADQDALDLALVFNKMDRLPQRDCAHQFITKVAIADPGGESLPRIAAQDRSPESLPKIAAQDRCPRSLRQRRILVAKDTK